MHDGCSPPLGLVSLPLREPLLLRGDPDELDLAVLVAASILIVVDGPEHGPTEWAPWPQVHGVIRIEGRSMHHTILFVATLY